MMDPLQKVRWDVVRQCAEDFARPYSAPPIPVLEIAQDNGIDVVFSDFGRHRDIVSGLCDFEARKIYVNDLEGFGRKMFTIAHEFGHWVLHRQWFESDPDLYAVLPRIGASEKNAFETEANLFAAEILVPKHLLAPVKGAGAARLAEIFNVSRTMMENRLKNV